jgi:hypothetical protein
MVHASVCAPACSHSRLLAAQQPAVARAAGAVAVLCWLVPLSAGTCRQPYWLVLNLSAFNVCGRWQVHFAGVLAHACMACASTPAGRSTRQPCCAMFHLAFNYPSCSQWYVDLGTD